MKSTERQLENQAYWLKRCLDLDVFTDFQFRIRGYEIESMLNSLPPATTEPYEFHVWREMVKKIEKLLPVAYYGPNNPNNGGLYHDFRIGREGSTVMYLAIYKNNYPKTTDWSKVSDALIGLHREMSIDEADIKDEDDHSLTIRYWWD